MDPVTQRRPDRRICDANGKDITDTVCKYKGFLEHRRLELTLAGHAISDVILRVEVDFCHVSLVHLDVSNTLITIQGLKALEQCQNLRYLDIGNCKALMDDRSASDRSGSDASGSGTGPSQLTTDINVVMKKVIRNNKRGLRTLKCANIALSGKVFYQGKIIDVQNSPGKEPGLSVEGKYAQHDANCGQAIVRDDSPKLFLEEGKKKLFYSETKCKHIPGASTLDERDYTYQRYYVELGWLQSLTHVDLSGTNLSGNGMVTVCAACGNTLQTLDISNCANVKSNAIGEETNPISAIVKLCKNLKNLNISTCGIDLNELMWLSTLEEWAVKQLRSIDAFNLKVDDDMCKALFLDLEASGFRGEFRYGRTYDDEGQPLTSFHSCIGTGEDSLGVSSRYDKDHFKLDDPHIVNIHGEDITESVLKPWQESQGDQAAASEKYWALNLSEQAITNRMLGLILQNEAFADSLRELNLNETYVGEEGLKMLVKCPNLRVLHLSKLHLLLQKSKTNKALAEPMKKMQSLESMYLNDTRISGRILSFSPTKKFVVLNAARTPISYRAMSLLVKKNNSRKTLRELDLSGCSFVNEKCLALIMKFKNLERVSVAHCRGLSGETLFCLREWDEKNLKHFKELDVSGIQNSDYQLDELTRLLTQKVRKYKHRENDEVVVLGTNESKYKESSPHGNSLGNYVDFSDPKFVAAARSAAMDSVADEYTCFQAADAEEKLVEPPSTHPDLHHNGTGSYEVNLNGGGGESNAPPSTSPHSSSAPHPHSSSPHLLSISPHGSSPHDPLSSSPHVSTLPSTSSTHTLRGANLEPPNGTTSSSSNGKKSKSDARRQRKKKQERLRENYTTPTADMFKRNIGASPRKQNGIAPPPSASKPNTAPDEYLAFSNNDVVRANEAPPSTNAAATGVSSVARAPPTSSWDDYRVFSEVEVEKEATWQEPPPVKELKGSETLSTRPFVPPKRRG